MTLTAGQFPDFYRAVNGYCPFPWQTRLVETVVALSITAVALTVLAQLFVIAAQANPMLRSGYDRSALWRTCA